MIKIGVKMAMVADGLNPLTDPMATTIAMKNDPTTGLYFTLGQGVATKMDVTLEMLANLHAEAVAMSAAYTAATLGPVPTPAPVV